VKTVEKNWEQQTQIHNKNNYRKKGLENL